MAKQASAMTKTKTGTPVRVTSDGTKRAAVAQRAMTPGEIVDAIEIDPDWFATQDDIAVIAVELEAIVRAAVLMARGEA